MSRHSIRSRMRALRVDIDPEVEERHVAAVLRELRQAPVASAPVVAPRLGRRRLVATLAAAFALLLPAAAFAAEDSVPGDLLYPVKQSTEWARSLFDPGVAQQHRVRELEIVIDRDAPIAVVTDRFDASVDAVEDQDPELIRRVEEARERIRAQYGVDLDPAAAENATEKPDGDSDVGNGETSRSGTEQRSGDAGTGTSGTTTSTTSGGSGSGSGTGSGSDVGTQGDTTPTTTRAANGQPGEAPDPGSGGNQP